MENVTAISVTAAYGLAGLLFSGVVFAKWAAGRGEGGSPPALPAGKVPVWLYREVDILAVIAIAGFFFLMAMSNAVVGSGKEVPKISMEGLLINVGVQFFLAATAVAIVASRIRLSQWLGLGWRQWPLVLVIAPVTVVSMWAVFAGLYSIGYMELMESLGVKKVQDTVAIFQQEEDTGILVLMAFTAVIVAPVCEEVVFRGYLYPVAKKFTGRWVAGICTALVFSAAHGGMSTLLPLFIFGLVLVALYEFTGSIWAPMAVHFLFNGATVAIQLLTRFGYIPEAPVR